MGDIYSATDIYLGNFPSKSYTFPPKNPSYYYRIVAVNHLDHTFAGVDHRIDLFADSNLAIFAVTDSAACFYNLAGFAVHLVAGMIDCNGRDPIDYNGRDPIDCNSRNYNTDCRSDCCSWGCYLIYSGTWT